MLSRISSLGSSLTVLTLLLFAGSAGAQDVSPRCEAAIDRAAGRYGKCLLRAEARNARHENADKRHDRRLRCQAGFDQQTARALVRYGEDECAPRDLVSAIAVRAVYFARGAAVEAEGEPAVELLFVQSADGGELTETTLVLSGVQRSTTRFTDRPYRQVGRMATAEFVTLFSEEGAASFAADPPNADFACEVNGEAVNQVVTLTDPVSNGNDLSYTVALVSSAGGDESFSGITCDADAHLFIDKFDTEPNVDDANKIPDYKLVEY